jgi:2-dehydropantoate 2-reductase
MEVVIFGAGAMGGRFANCFQKGGAEVTMVDVWKEHVDAINKDGLQIENFDGSIETARIPAVMDAKNVEPADLVVIFTKSAQTEMAVHDAEAIMRSDTPVMTVQNGVGNIELIEKMVGKNRLIGGCTQTATSLEGPGRIRIEGPAHSDIMAFGEKCKGVCEEVKRILEAGGMETVISENVLFEVWHKLAFNCAMNTITAITRQIVGYTAAYGAQLAGWIIEEVAKVARSEGIEIDTDRMMDGIRFVTGPDGDKSHLTSMLQDVARKKQTEIDSIVGTVIQKAKAKEIPVPHLETVYNLVRIIESNYDKAVG